MQPHFQITSTFIFSSRDTELILLQVLRYADDMTLMTVSEEELKNLLMKEESEKSGIKLNIRKTKIMASGPITSWQIDGGEWKQ